MDKGQIKIRLKNELFLKLKSEAYLSGKTLNRYISDRLEFPAQPPEISKNQAQGPDIKNILDEFLGAIKNELRMSNSVKKSGGIDPITIRFLIENLAWIRLYMINFGGRVMQPQDASDAQKNADSRSRTIIESVLKEMGV